MNNFRKFLIAAFKGSDFTNKPDFGKAAGVSIAAANDWIKESGRSGKISNPELLFNQATEGMTGEEVFAAIELYKNIHRNLKSK